MTAEMLDLLAEAIDVAENDQMVRCVVVTGAGDRAFCAGADVSSMATMTPEVAEAFSRKGHHTFLKILRLSKPVVAAVNGHALGGGCELAAACDIRIASDRARFGQPEVNLGFIPGWGGTQLLPRIVGPTKAKELLLTGQLLSASEALQAGLINKVVPSEKLIEEVNTLTAYLVNGPPIALAAAKKLVNSGLQLEAGFASEGASFGRIFSSADAKEGMAAFVQKRKPVFKGE